MPLILTDAPEQPISPIFKGQEIQEWITTIRCVIRRAQMPLTSWWKMKSCTV